MYEFSDLQSGSIVFKLALIIELLVELILYTIELFFFNKFRTRLRKSRQKFALSEKSKRKRFGPRYALVNAIWTSVCVLAILGFVLTSDKQGCRSN